MKSALKNQIIESLQNRIPTLIDPPTNQFAILLPIIEKNGELHILFEVRSKNLHRQPSEVCFPGGRIEESDKSPEKTAMRETCEELGICSSDIEHVFPIDYIQSGITIHVYAGFLNTTNFKLNNAEVESLFTVPLQFFQAISPNIHRVELKPHVDDTFPYHLIPLGKDYKWQSRYLDEYFYQYEDKVIWGLTARILHHFLELIK